MKSCKTVKDLIAVLQKCNPEATLIVSESPGRGAAQCIVLQGFTDAYGEECADEEDGDFNIPAVEITAML